MRCLILLVIFLLKQRTAYKMRISDWISDVCSSDLPRHLRRHGIRRLGQAELLRAMNKHLLLLPVGLAVTLGGLALAQSAPAGIDLEAIRERAAEHADDAQALSTNVRQRAEALTEDGPNIQAQEHANCCQCGKHRGKQNQPRPNTRRRRVC